MIKNNTTTAMKNYSAHELVDLIVKVKRTQGDFNNSIAYPFATGVLIALIDSSRNGQHDLQTEINNNYRHYSKELYWAQENLKKVA
jgi:hypothetical protein